MVAFTRGLRATALMCVVGLAGCNLGQKKDDSLGVGSTNMAQSESKNPFARFFPKKDSSTAAVPEEKDSVIPFWQKDEPKQANADFYISYARIKEQSKDLDGARQGYTKALEKEPNHPQAMLGLARIDDANGNMPAATEGYLKVVRAHPMLPAGYNDLGLCYARQGKLADSERALRKAVELDPRKPLYRNNLATVMVNMGREAEAMSQLRSVYDEATANYNLGVLVMNRGDAQVAQQYFSRAASLNPAMAGVDATGGNPSSVAARPQDDRGNAGSAAGSGPSGQPGDRNGGGAVAQQGRYQSTNSGNSSGIAEQSAGHGRYGERVARGTNSENRSSGADNGEKRSMESLPPIEN